MATGLTILVDDRIREVWEIPKQAQTQHTSRMTSTLGQPWPPYKSPYTNHKEKVVSPINKSTLPWSPLKGSVVSQTLEDYPALTSYALSRVFVHARAGLAKGTDPGEILKKLVLQKCWERWYLLQERVSGLHTWQDVLKLQDLSPWISIAEEICEKA